MAPLRPNDDKFVKQQDNDDEVIVIFNPTGSKKKLLESLQKARLEHPGLPIFIAPELDPERDIVKVSISSLDLLLTNSPETQYQTNGLSLLSQQSLLRKCTNWMAKKISAPFSLRSTPPSTIQKKDTNDDFIIAEKQYLKAAEYSVSVNCELREETLQPILPAFESLQNRQNNFYIQLFGKLTISFEGNECLMKGLPVMAYLFLHHEKQIHKEKLMERFWPSSSGASAKNCLNVAIWNSRKCLSECLGDKNLILYSNPFYAINPTLSIQTDVDQFDALWNKAYTILRTQGIQPVVKDFQKMVDLYRGELLEDYQNVEWAEEEREKFRERFLSALSFLSAHFFDNENYTACIDYCIKALQNDDCLEEIHRRLMECYFKLNLKDKAIKQYQKCCASLKKLSAYPSKETVQLFDFIKEN